MPLLLQCSADGAEGLKGYRRRSAGAVRDAERAGREAAGYATV